MEMTLLVRGLSRRIASSANTRTICRVVPKTERANSLMSCFHTLTRAVRQDRSRLP
jgi:hypothetical protein